MPQILVFALGVVVGGTAAWVFITRYKTRSVGVPQGNRPELIEKQARVKAENKKKILDLLADKGQVSNNDIERALGVSDATATRYLDELEREGRLRQIGQIGSGVHYERLNGR